LCIIPDEKILKILKSRTNFKKITDLQDLSINLLGIISNYKKRKDVETDITIKFMQNGITVEKLLPYIKQPTKRIKKPRKITTKKPKKGQKKKTVKISDQVERWMPMNIEEIRLELNNLEKYPDGKTLKMAANSILKKEDKRKRKRNLIIDLIIQRLEEEKAILMLGS